MMTSDMDSSMLMILLRLSVENYLLSPCVSSKSFDENPSLIEKNGSHRMYRWRQNDAKNDGNEESNSQFVKASDLMNKLSL